MAVPLLGRNITHADDFDTKLAAEVGASPSASWTRIYLQTQAFTTGSPWSQIWTRNALGESVIVSTTRNDTLTNITAGAQDTYFTNIANGLVANATQDVIYIFIHEPENPSKSNNATQYRAAATHVFNLMNPILHPAGHRTAIALMGWTCDSRPPPAGSGRDPNDWYVPECDIVLFDSYSTLGSSDGASPGCLGLDARSYQDPLQLFGDCADFAISVGKPYAHAEVGAAQKLSDTTGAQQATFWDLCADQRALDGNEFVSMFEMGCSDGFIESAVRNKPAVLTAFARNFETGVVEATVHQITGTSNTDATLITDGAVDTDMDPRALCVCEDNILRFDPDNTTTLTIDAQNLMFMDTARLEMKPANSSVIHTLKFTSVDESQFVGSDPYTVNSVTGSGTTRTFTLQLRNLQTSSHLTADDRVTLFQFYGGSTTNFNNDTNVAGYSGTFPINSVGTPTGAGGTQTIVVQFPSDPGPPGALSMPVPGASNVTAFAGVIVEAPAVNDHGLWVMDGAVADLVGTAKLGWGRASTSLSAGATTVTVKDSVTGANADLTGWVAGDEILFSPTDLSIGKQEIRRIVSVNQGTSTVTFGYDGVNAGVSGSTVPTSKGNLPVQTASTVNGLVYDHPAVTVKAGLTLGCEVANLTRNVRIEGTPPVLGVNHRTHFMFHNTTPTPQTVKYIQLRYMGPREVGVSGEGGQRKIVGRWPFHFHKEHANSVGSQIEGCVTRDCGSHSYVQHASNGVTISDCISYANMEISFWWDQDSVVGRDSPSDVVWDHNMVGFQFDTATANRMAGFLMAQTVLPEGDATMRDCCSWGVRGGTEGGGGGWNTEGSTAPTATQWITEGTTVMHNNQFNGFGSWINAPNFRSDHSDFVLYRNGRGGLSPEGAYSTNLSYTRVTMFENGWNSNDNPYQWRSLANAKVDPNNQWSTRTYCYADSGGLVGTLLVGETNSNGDGPLQMLDCHFRNSLGPAITLDMIKVGIQKTYQRRDFVRCSVRDVGSSTDHDITLADIDNIFLVGQSRLRFQSRDDQSAFEMFWTLNGPGNPQPQNDTTNTFVVNTIAPFALRVTTQSLPQGVVGVAYGPGGAGKTLTADLNQGAITWGLKYNSAALPPGMALSSAGLFSGTPTTVGTFPFTVEVTDARGVTAPKDFAFDVAGSASLQITTTTLPGGFVGVSYSQTLASTGGSGAKTWTLASGTLPAGVGLSSAGVISGTPTTVGSSSFTVRVTDAATNTDTQDLVISVTNPTPSIGNTSPLPTGELTVAYSTTLTVTGGTGPYTFSIVSGNLQTGLSLAASTGVISGTPTQVAVRSIVFRVTDALAVATDKTLSLTTVNVVSLAAGSPQPGVVGRPYSYAFLVQNGVAPYSFELISPPGISPPGLSLDTNGVLSGTPSQQGTYNFSLRVVDGAEVAINASVTMLIRKHQPKPHRGLSVRGTSKFPSGN